MPIHAHAGRWLAAATAVFALAVCSSAGGTTQNSPTTPAVASTGGRSPASATSSAASPLPDQSPVPPESNPPGDIPDNTAFVPFRSAAGGFRISIPEGWARAETHGSVSFTDKLNSITVAWRPTSSAPTTGSAKGVDVTDLQRSVLAFRLKSVASTSLPAGPAVLIVYEANSAPNPVTGKQYRLVVERFELFHHNEEAILSLSSPVGADNVDPWRTVSESFGWS